MIPPTKRIRALDRGMAVVELLATRGACSLSDLAGDTGLSNATLLRVLATLEDRGWVRRRLARAEYELTGGFAGRFACVPHADPLAEAATPHLRTLLQLYPDMPSDLCRITADGRVEMVESTRTRGPMAPSGPPLGFRPSMVLSAHGRAMLAFTPEPLRDRYLDSLARKGTREERGWIESGRLRAELTATRAQGYGRRAPGYWDTRFDPGPELGALAIPILGPNGIIGTISLMWIAKDNTPEALPGAQAVLDLKGIAGQIARDMRPR